MTCGSAPRFDRPTPEQIAEIAEHKWDVLEVLALWGYVIVHPDDVPTPTPTEGQAMTVPFTEARPGEESWVYKCPPGWEFGWVTDTEYFTDELHDPITVKRQQWQLIDQQEVTFYPSLYLCERCAGDGEVGSKSHDDPERVTCPRCDGSGDDPNAGRMVVTKP